MCYTHTFDVVKFDNERIKFVMSKLKSCSFPQKKNNLLNNYENSKCKMRKDLNSVRHIIP